MQISLLLDMAADSFGDRHAVTAGEETIDFAELRDRARRAAAYFCDSGADAITFVGANSVSLPVALFGSSYAGKPFAPLNYRLPDLDLRKLLARTAPSIAIVDDEMLDRVCNIAGVTVMASSMFDALVADPASPAIEDEVEGDIAVLLFTSGTTGEPKAAVLRHHNLTSYVISTVEFMGAEEDEAALVSVPPYHIAGMSAILTGVYGGRRTVYLSTFSAEEWVTAAAVERVTHTMVVPTMLDRILSVMETRNERLPSLQALSYGGGRMPLPVVERALAMLPQVGFVNAYGLTETSSTIALLGPEEHRAALVSDDPAVRERLGSVGRPLPTLDLEIRDDDGRVCVAGEAGEIHVRGEQVAGEYLHASALSSDGWFATKDLGWLDADGFLYVDGRLDDVIVRGGENISPGEIEDVLRSHESVVDVAVLGIPDNVWGEAIAAVIVSRASNASPEELDAWVRTRLRSTKTPVRWEFRQELPYNETGKLLRRVLKADLSAAPV
jgi:fatty-acyl-CoA synthase